MSYLLVILEKVSIFAARLRRIITIKTRYNNEKNISTLEQKEKEQTRFP